MDPPLWRFLNLSPYSVKDKCQVCPVTDHLGFLAQLNVYFLSRYIKVMSNMFVLRTSTARMRTQVWIDPKLAWSPDKYGGLRVIRLPHDAIWRPDILLYNKYVTSINDLFFTRARLTFHISIQLRFSRSFHLVIYTSKWKYYITGALSRTEYSHIFFKFSLENLRLTERPCTKYKV